MNTIEFYNVKKKAKVQINSKDVSKTTYERKNKDGSTRISYALKAQDDDGCKLTKFVKKEVYDAN